MNGECKSCRDVCGAWWAEAAADCIALNAESIEINGEELGCELLEIYDLATDAWYCPTNGEWGDWSALNGPWENEIDIQKAKRQWHNDPSKLAGGYFSFADGGGYCVELCLRKIGGAPDIAGDAAAVGMFKDCTWTEEVECREDGGDCGCGIELPTYWGWPEGKCCCSTNECCEECMQGDSALYGDLSCRCEKKLIAEMNSLSAGSVIPLNYNCNLANLPDCQSDNCGVGQLHTIHKGDTYVVEFETNSVNKFNHNNHWWEIIFEKCEPEEFDWAKVLDPFMQTLANSVDFSMIAISYGGEIVYEEYFSRSNLDPQYELAKWLDLEEDEQPKVNAASCGKAITALAIAVLYDKGLLSPGSFLVDVLRKYFYDSGGNALFSDGRYQSITVEMLAAHGGGWDRVTKNTTDIAGHVLRSGGVDTLMYNDHHAANDLVKMFPNDYPSGITLPLQDKDLIKWIVSNPLEFTPGSKSIYSNIGYFFMATIVEEISGMPYDQFVKKYLYDKLDVKIDTLMPSDFNSHDFNPRFKNKEVPYELNKNKGISAFAGEYRYDPATGLVNGMADSWPGLSPVNWKAAIHGYGTYNHRHGPGGLICTPGNFVKLLNIWDDTPEMNAIISKTTKDYIAGVSAKFPYAYGIVNQPALTLMTMSHGGYIHNASSNWIRYYDSAGMTGNANCASEVRVFVSAVGWGAAGLVDPSAGEGGWVDNVLTPAIQLVLKGCKGPTCEPAFDVGDEIALNGKCDPDGGGGGIDPPPPGGGGGSIDPPPPGGGGSIPRLPIDPITGFTYVWGCHPQEESCYQIPANATEASPGVFRYSSEQECRRYCGGGGMGGMGGMGMWA